MKIIRFSQDDTTVVAAVTRDNKVYALPFNSFIDLVDHSRNRGLSTIALLNEMITDSLPLEVDLEELNLLVPIEAPEVWAAGVTYKKSKEARNYEATNGKLDVATFYDKVYDAERPELFLKSTKERTVGPEETLLLRNDSSWQIPEPELGLVLHHDGKIIGYTIGNDMSCRDIEGENPLYLPQAKIWNRSCSIGPAILLAEATEDPYQFEISCKIVRNNEMIFNGNASTNQLNRRLEELVQFLKRDNIIFPGTVLLTGTCIVPPNEFTLEDSDLVEIEITSIGKLVNPIKRNLAISTL